MDLPAPQMQPDMMRKASIAHGTELLKLNLINDIALAFLHVQRNNGTTWHEAEAIDNHATDEERKQARTHDTDHRWQDVKDEWLEQFPMAVRFLDLPGLHYYLPAIMTWDLRRTATTENTAADELQALLLDPTKSAQLAERISIHQRQTIAHWLSHRLNHEHSTNTNPLEALDNSPWANPTTSNDANNT